MQWIVADGRQASNGIGVTVIIGGDQRDLLVGW